jgi:hypothetical protein
MLSTNQYISNIRWHARIFCLIQAMSDKPAATKDITRCMCFTTDDDWEEVEHKSDEEEDDVMAAVAAMTKRDAQLQEQLPKAAFHAADPAAAEEALGPSWSDLEVLLLFITIQASRQHVNVCNSSLGLHDMQFHADQLNAL